ncbi:nuclear transport factor 2 family protein [Lacimicrobium alkaliphilum]|uniref:SnoaL-like domain-containing protein n=1 Tax=Lacimicrobium alkaliphilum TaxID=1526571 RepID=A0A0U3BBX0_9ALTE|nr:nuclear transport factor 2 family protein [Lacimicrobium alkaliphilum]ALS99157.1 hypothetical protein AT746_13415 [Lacimicrobium alkaliphilum]
MNTELSEFRAFYEQLQSSSLSQLPSVYSEDVRFIDPVAEHHGLDALDTYFGRLLENCGECRFTIHSCVLQGQQGFVTWTMIFSHPKVKKGAMICVDGCSEIMLNTEQKVCQQRDYYDLGAMLYQHLPLIGPVINWLKKRLNS